MDKPKLLRTESAAKLLGLSTRHFRRACMDKIPAHNLGTRDRPIYFYMESDVLILKQEREVKQ